MDTALIWIEFFLCLVIILIAGKKVAGYGDIIAARTGIGGLWIGLLLLAIVTSLPELFSGISAVILVESPDLAIGAVFGSNAFNLLILVFLEIAYTNGPVLTSVNSRHLLPAGLSVVLISLPAIFIIITTPDLGLGIGWIGIYTPALILLFLIFMRMIFLREQENSIEFQMLEENQENKPASLKRTYLYFIISAAFVVGAGIWLAFVGEDIAEATGWKESFVGSLFIAFTTSLPEMVVSFAALKLGALDMCLGNIIGSNLFNMAIIGIDDLFYRQNPILADVSNSHAFTGLMVVLMTCVVIAGLIFKAEHKTSFRVSWYAPVLLILYLIAAYASFTIK